MRRPRPLGTFPVPGNGPTGRLRWVGVVGRDVPHQQGQLRRQLVRRLGAAQPRARGRRRGPRARPARPSTTAGAAARLWPPPAERGLLGCEIAPRGDLGLLEAGRGLPGGSASLCRRRWRDGRGGSVSRAFGGARQAPRRPCPSARHGRCPALGCRGRARPARGAAGNEAGPTLSPRGTSAARPI